MKWLLALVVLFFAAGGCSTDEELVADSNPVPEASLVGFDVAPEPIHTVTPEYPPSARRAGIQGTVHLEILIDTDGHVLETRLLESAGHDDLDEAARVAATQWTFQPAQLSGEPVVAKIVIPFAFKLR